MITYSRYTLHLQMEMTGQEDERDGQGHCEPFDDNRDNGKAFFSFVSIIYTNILIYFNVLVSTNTACHP
jgi:hypothetical protein